MKVRAIGFAMIALSCWLHAQQAQPAQEQPAAPDSGVLIRTETNLVLVDAIVTDKKGAYVADLKEKDFKVFEDGKEQPLKSFSFEADPVSGTERTHYLALMFDNASMSTGDQMRARQAAAKFIDGNAGPNRMMTVVNSSGIASGGQEFTADPAKLKAIVNGLQTPLIRTTDPDGKPSMSADLAIHSTLDNIRTLAKSMSGLPGRKILVWFTAGFPLNSEEVSEVTAIVSDCNRDNVAIYPVDVRGVVTGAPSLRNRLELPPLFAPPAMSVFRTVAFVPNPPFAPQARGGGAPAGGGSNMGGHGGETSSAPSGRGSTSTSTSSGSKSGTQSGTTSTGRGPTGAALPAGAGVVCGAGPAMAGGSASPGGVSPCNANRVLIPQLPSSVVGNQQVMYQLADGTGGFVIHDDNDILAALDKIGKEQNQYYLLGYTPPDAKPGSCHEIKVKVDRGGVEVRARSGYCSAKPLDVLSSTSPVTKGLEAEIADAKPGKIGGGMRAPFFYTGPNVARVNLAMDIATDQLKFEKKKGEKNDLHSQVDILGIAYTQQGTVAARFSDTVNLDYTDKDDADAAKRLPLHYENQFDIAPGKYTLKVAYSEGNGSYGRLEIPLDVSSYASDTLGVSALALSKQYRKVSELGGLLDVAMLEDKKPLIANGLEIVPTGTPTYSKEDLAIFYVEMYEPLLASGDASKAPQLGIRMRVLDRKTGEQKSDTGLLALSPAPPVGEATIPMGSKLPVSGLPPGEYTLEFTVADSANRTAQRTADFDIQ